MYIISYFVYLLWGSILILMLLNQEYFLTIQSETQSEFKDRGSKFYGFAYPIASINEIKVHLKNLKSVHVKAVHFCYAYRLGIDGNNFRASDDGEPSGSAGKPILGQIDAKGITNVLVVIVRYWGGVLLGVPGLIHAYKTSACFAVNDAEIIEQELMLEYELEFDYTILDAVIRSFKLNRVEVSQRNQGLFCQFSVKVPKKNKSSFELSITEFYQLKFKVK
jgi:uncharacterized YigZ family protein